MNKDYSLLKISAVWFAACMAAVLILAIISPAKAQPTISSVVISPMVKKPKFRTTAIKWSDEGVRGRVKIKTRRYNHGRYVGIHTVVLRISGTSCWGFEGVVGIYNPYYDDHEDGVINSRVYVNRKRGKNLLKNTAASLVSRGKAQFFMEGDVRCPGPWDPEIHIGANLP